MKMTARKCQVGTMTIRLHVVLDPSEGNFMVIEDEVRHTPNYIQLWKTDTTYKHTAFYRKLCITYTLLSTTRWIQIMALFVESVKPVQEAGHVQQ